MRSVQMNNNGSAINGLVEINHNMQHEHHQPRDGIIDEDQRFSDDGQSRTNEDVDDVNDRDMEVDQAQAHAESVIQRPQQQPQAPLVRWEKFLPFQSLKVLLVENDDSTRHVVSALLRNCGYEVTAVENGLQAWKLLEDLTNHIDLVLTEVVMPCLSGFGLLCKIMSHNICKNIPVILMSSRDSINIVFKCLSKGAVDFLVKPIRKNELKNLWQHVWRKCHSSSGSGSDGGVQNEKSTKSKSAEDSDNNTGSNDGDDIGSIGLNVRDGSDNGSGTQPQVLLNYERSSQVKGETKLPVANTLSSWAKRAVEVESPKPMSPWGQSADPQDSTCTEAIHLRPEALDNKRVPVSTTKECEGKDKETENIALGKDLEIGVPGIANLQLEGPKDVVIDVVGNYGESLPEGNSKEVGEQKDKGQLEFNGKKPDEDLMKHTADLLGVIANNFNSKRENVVTNIPNGLSDMSNNKNKSIYGTKEKPSLEQSLKRQRDPGDNGTNEPDHNGLKHSVLSAFTRYNSSSAANRVPTANVRSCSLLGNIPKGVYKESFLNLESKLDSVPPNQHTNGSDNAFTKPGLPSDKPALTSTSHCLEPYYSASQPMHYLSLHIPQPAMKGKPNAADSKRRYFHTRDSMKQQQVQVQHHHHHYHHHHHHVHNLQQQQQPTIPDDLSLKNMAAEAAPQCGSSNMLSMPVDETSGNKGSNRIASGIDYCSSRQNWSSSGNPKGATFMSDNGVTDGCGTSDAIVLGSRIRVDESRLAQREAALNKFRQKRKERCFEKKVRYLSRKKLAEQRPRVRGQFVRHVAQENKDKDGHS